jgi:DNA-binding CsgD family transcriptional regulator
MPDGGHSNRSIGQVHNERLLHCAVRSNLIRRYGLGSTERAVPRCRRARPAGQPIVVRPMARACRARGQDDNWLRLANLSDRQADLLTWVARGKSSTQIAEMLGLLEKTVQFDLDRARFKLAACSIT